MGEHSDSYVDKRQLPHAPHLDVRAKGEEGSLEALLSAFAKDAVYK